MKNWHRVTASMLQSEDGRFQISRSPRLAGRITYRAWRRVGNQVLLTIDVPDEPGERATAAEKCKAACESQA